MTVKPETMYNLAASLYKKASDYREEKLCKTGGTSTLIDILHQTDENYEDKILGIIKEESP